MIYCFGDSLTEGVPGATYITFLKNKENYINCGVGGDTLLDMKKRLIKKIDNIDNIIISIGINDILSPFFLNYSKSWNIAIKLKRKKGSIATKNFKEFEDNYIDMIKLIKNKKVILTGIPLLESNLDVLNEDIIKLNKIIENIAKEYNFPFIDILETIKKYHTNLKYDINDNWFNVLSDVIITRKQENIDKLSKERDLILTVDGIHYNNMAAKIVAKLIEEQIDYFNN